MRSTIVSPLLFDAPGRGAPTMTTNEMRHAEPIAAQHH
jgi:hypothetical protein